MNIQNNNLTFTSRCKQIKAGQQVCHIITSKFPHLSSTRISPFVSNIEDKYPHVFDEFISANPQAGRYMQLTSSLDKKIAGIFAWKQRLVISINQERSARKGIVDDFSKVYALISQFKHAKMANCGENAKLAEVILKLKGLKNVYTGCLKVGDKKVDHMVCFFNKDGSAFNGTVNKNTIIVDPWTYEVDFADNMLLRYRNSYKEHLFIPKDGKLTFRNVKNYNLSDKELAQIASEFPELL